MTGRNMLGVAFRVVGIGFAAIAIVVVAFTLLFISRSESVRGMVVANKTVENEIKPMPRTAESGVLFYPVIAYSDADGISHEFTGPSGRSHPQFPVGTPVDVLVSYRDPENARLATVLGVWGTAIVLGIVALIFIILGFAAPLGFGGSHRGNST